MGAVVTVPVKPPFTYFGGKTAIASKIASLLPAHEHYVEPYCGSLAVLLAKPPSMMETVNDLDGELINFWRVLRTRLDEFSVACALTPHSRLEADIAEDNANQDLDDLERARRLWVRLTQCRGGHTVHRSGWRFYRDARGSTASMPDYLDAYVSRLGPAVARLRGVSLENRAALEVIAGYGQHARTLLYVDPPYPESVRKKCSGGRSRGPYYAHEVRTDADHTLLLEALLGCKSAVLVSGYACPLYDEALAAWHRREVGTQTGNGGGDRARTEVLWCNRPWAAATLFE
jgi:DNA adenine methylase